MSDRAVGCSVGHVERIVVRSGIIALVSDEAIDVHVKAVNSYSVSCIEST